MITSNSKQSQLKNIKISLIEKINRPTISATPSFYDFLTIAKNGGQIGGCNFVSTIHAIQSVIAHSGKKDNQVLELKKSLPKIFPHILLKKGDNVKNKDGILTGLFHFDVDNIPLEYFEDIEKILKSSNILAFLKSPSSTGLKIFYWTDLHGSQKDQETLFKNIWGALGRLLNTLLSPFGCSIDESQKAMNSGFFMSFDPNLWCSDAPHQIKVADLDFTYGTCVNLQKLNEAQSVKPTITRTKSSKNIKKSSIHDRRYPNPNEIALKLSCLSSLKQKQAMSAISTYFETPSGQGLRYSSFFKMATILSVLGKNKNRQVWDITEFESLLRLLDYDGSRLEKNQITDTLLSLIKYDHLSASSASNNKPSQERVTSSKFQSHLDIISNANQCITVDKFVSEAHDQILETIKQKQIVGILSPTGSGKSTFVLGNLVNSWKNGKIYLLLPYRSILAQLKSKWDDARIQFLDQEGDTFDSSKKLFVLTYEKLEALKKDVDMSNSLICVDEAHLWGDSFREKTYKCLISFMQETVQKKSVHWFFMSATQHVFLSALKVYENVHILKLKTKRPPLSVSIKMVHNLDGYVISRVREILSKNVTSKILIFKNNKYDLDRLKDQFDASGIRSIIVTGDTKTDDDVQSIFEQKIPSENVILATNLMELGVECPYVQNTICIGKNYSTENIVQMGDRGRNGSPVEWILLDKEIEKPSFSFKECFSEVEVESYKDLIDAWLLLEKQRFNFAFNGKAKLNQAEQYIQCMNRSVFTSETNKHLYGLTQINENQDLTCDIGFSLQGFIRNLTSYEGENESNIEYLRLKMLVLWGVKTDIMYPSCVDENVSTTKISNLWEMLADMPISTTETLLKDVECFMINKGVKNHDIHLVLKNIEKRYKMLMNHGLDVKTYILVKPKDWKEVEYQISIKYSPTSFHPLEHAVKQHLLSEDLLNKPIFSSDIENILQKMKCPDEANHLRKVICSYSEIGKSRFFNRIVRGISARRKNQKSGKKERCIVSMGFSWDDLKNDNAPSIFLTPYHAYEYFKERGISPPSSVKLLEERVPDDLKLYKNNHYSSGYCDNKKYESFVSDDLIESESFVSNDLIESESFVSNDLIESESFVSDDLIESESFVSDDLIESDNPLKTSGHLDFESIALNETSYFEYGLDLHHFTDFFIPRLYAFPFKYGVLSILLLASFFLF